MKKPLRYAVLLALIPIYMLLGIIWIAGDLSEIFMARLDRRDERLRDWAGTEW